MILVVAFLVLGCQVKSEETDQEVQLNCPDGWIAYQVHYYTCGYLPMPQNIWYPKSNCSTCLTCKRNSILEHPFSLVELCAVFWPEIITSSNYYVLPEKCTENICNGLYYQTFCGMSLRVSNNTITSETFLPCPNIHHEIQDNSQSIELVCPRSFSFKTLFQRNVSNNYQSQRLTNTRSVCLTCDHNSAIGINGKKLKITMCSPHFKPDENKINQVTTKNLLECQQQDTSKCAPDTILPIQRGLHCGSKFTGSSYKNSVNISNYIPCDHGQKEQTTVKQHFILMFRHPIYLLNKRTARFENVNSC